MLLRSRAFRLVSQHEFQFVFANPRKITGKCLLALYRANSLAHARLGITISKHHVKRAVDRNRLRRVIRDSFRQRRAHLKGLDIVVLMRSEWSPSELGLRDEIDTIWQRLINSSSVS